MRKLMTRFEIEKSIPGFCHNSFGYIAPRAGVLPVAEEIFKGRRRLMYDPKSVELLRAYLKKSKEAKRQSVAIEPIKPQDSAA